MIVRMWRGITSTDRADAYLAHLRETALPALRDVPGLEQAWVLRREQGERCEFQLMTLWRDIEAVRAWTGGEAEQAVYFDQDDRYLLDMQPLVRLYEVCDRLPPAAE